MLKETVTSLLEFHQKIGDGLVTNAAVRGKFLLKKIKLQNEIVYWLEYNLKLKMRPNVKIFFFFFLNHKQKE